MAIADDRAKAVELALSQIEKQFGKGSIVRLGSREALLPIAVISTGSISFDAALGVGGIRLEFLEPQRHFGTRRFQQARNLTAGVLLVIQ
jgi:hypothetical protein